MRDAELATVPLADIEFGDRARIDYGDLAELAGSIKSRGLIQPLAVCKQDGDKPYLLLAGGRRMKAMEVAEVERTPIRIYPAGLSDLEIKSIELAENLHRKDFDWTEQVKLQREIHDLQVAIHGSKVSTAPDAEGWSMQDTAELVGRDKSSVSKDIELAAAMESVPELFDKCKNKSEAQKVLKAAKEDMIIEELARRAEQTKPTSKSAKQQLCDCFIIKDFFEGVKDVPDSSINIVELDPPYGIDLDKQKKQDESGNIRNYNEVARASYPEFMQNVLSECYRVMSKDSWLVVWFAPEPWFEDTYQWITKAGFKTTRMCGIWTKRTGQTMAPATNLSNTYEMFFLCRKGSPVLVQQGRSNVFDFPPVASQKKIHPTERPTELIREILTTVGMPGSRIMVPFLGSGATLIAAAECGMTGFGYELSKEFKDRFILKVHTEVN